MNDTRWLDAREARAWRGFMLMQGKLRRNVARQLLRDVGLSEADYEVLVHLSEAEGGRLRAVELGAATQWEKSRLFHQLTRMEGRGLVSRETCGNSRHAHVALTDKGRSVIEAAAPSHVEYVRQSFIEAMTPEQIDMLGDITEAVIGHLDGTDDGCCGGD
ncbi:MAG: MarR family transcriptional regulator [Ilumatobacteraceae bacterium]|nr:MarR family transcriptional regulator [Ilumatobacteraceae bacterium]